MLTLGNFLLQTRIHAIAVTLTLTVVSQLFLPLAYIASGAPLALVSMRKGVSAGAQVLLGSLALLLLLTSLVKLSPVVPVSIAVMVWLPVFLCAAVLRNSRLPSAMLLCAMTLAQVFLLIMHTYLLEHLLAGWQQWFAQAEAVAANAEIALRLQEIHETTRPLLSTMLLAGFYSNLVMTVFFARWWQARLFNPGGFRAEFHSMWMPRELAYMAFVVIALKLLMSIFSQRPLLLLNDLLVLFVLIYAVLGISVAHRFVSAHEMRRGWLVAMYCSLLLPQMVLLVACLGLAHNWLGRPRV